MIEGWNGNEICTKFGEHAGKRWRDLTEGYIRWKIQKCRDDIECAESELHRREEEAERAEALQLSNMGELERSVYAAARREIKEIHPDLAGGDNEKTVQALRRRDCLLEMIRFYKEHQQKALGGK